MTASTLQALTLDLDDTLWPVGPVIVNAERVLNDWLLAHAPATSARYPLDTMRRLRTQIGQQRPDLAHDLTELRLLSLRQALTDSGDDPALAEPAFECFFAERQRVTFYADVAPALDRLAARWPLLALSNGNAELEATGLSRWFVGSVNARSCGVAKPDARIFQAACARLGCEPGQVLHIGDDHGLDIVGARNAGLHTAWVRREGASEQPAFEGDGLHLRVRDLGELAGVLGV